jgi:hypothetical protein
MSKLCCKSEDKLPRIWIWKFGIQKKKKTEKEKGKGSSPGAQTNNSAQTECHPRSPTISSRAHALSFSHRLEDPTGHSHNRVRAPVVTTPPTPCVSRNRLTLSRCRVVPCCQHPSATTSPVMAGTPPVRFLLAWPLTTPGDKIPDALAFPPFHRPIGFALTPNF